jgi:hypothetical protein
MFNSVLKATYREDWKSPRNRQARQAPPTELSMATTIKG